MTNEAFSQPIGLAFFRTEANNAVRMFFLPVRVVASWARRGPLELAITFGAVLTAAAVTDVSTEQRSAIMVAQRSGPVVVAGAGPSGANVAEPGAANAIGVAKAISDLQAVQQLPIDVKLVGGVRRPRDQTPPADASDPSVERLLLSARWSSPEDVGRFTRRLQSLEDRSGYIFRISEVRVSFAGTDDASALAAPVIAEENDPEGSPALIKALIQARETQGAPFRIVSTPPGTTWFSTDMNSSPQTVVDRTWLSAIIDAKTPIQIKAVKIAAVQLDSTRPGAERTANAPSSR